MAGLPFAARSIPKTHFNHKIHHQIRFLQKIPAAFSFLFPDI
jgi:hypothetical protein